ncbi:MFS transporter [Sulfurisphaera ohwakuensis]|uniref:MFS family permease n=1 Tax=Sulfurisphaera ohwakuensis TaxID=69656 RepID=A0A650CFG8_SULOH|nr:MFS transporter [Sulfurisphaera ohwakuensis]MBB5254146.1 MFS family permease [Sulfurisphaera ohwakuensis]QGR16522.1 MFS transporter [Sulfurisphaera ohwakuensis]
MDKENFLLILSSSLNGVIWGANTIIIALYFKSLGLSPLLIGEILSGSIIISTFLSLLWGVLGDAYGRKKFFFVSRGLSTLSYFLLLFTPFAYLFTNQGYGLIASIIAEKSKDLDKDMAYRTSLNTLFSIIGSLLPVVLNYREIIISDFIIMVTTTLMLIPVRENYKGTRIISLKISSFKFLGKLSTEAIIGLGAGILLPMMSLWFNLKFGVSASSLSPIYALSEFSLAIGLLFSPYLGRLMGRIRAIFITHLIAIFILFLIPFSSDILIAGSLYVLRNTMMNLSSPLMSAFVMKAVREEERGRVNSMLQLLDAIPRSVGPSFTGYLFELGNLSVPFFITGTLYLIATLLFYYFFKDVKI